MEAAVVQVFVTDEPSFDKNKGANNASHELVCYLDKGQLAVARPDGKIAGQAVAASEINHVQIKVNKQFVIVEKDRQQLYAGPHGLAQDKPRHVGIRFLTKGAERAAEELNVPSVRILKP